MKILRVNEDHYVVDNVEQVERYALVLLNQRLTTGQVPDTMRGFASSVCTDEDGVTALALLNKLEDIELIPAKVL